MVEDLWREYRDLYTLDGAGHLHTVCSLLWLGRFSLITAVLAGVGRAAAEVGAILIVGGNIAGVTRTMTTAIALETSRGDLSLATRPRHHPSDPDPGDQRDGAVRPQRRQRGDGDMRAWVSVRLLVASWLLLVLSLPAVAQQPFITVASTTSTEESWLFGYLLPAFTNATIQVRVVAVGTGQARKIGERGDCDVLFVHDRPAVMRLTCDERPTVPTPHFQVLGDRGAYHWHHVEHTAACRWERKPIANPVDRRRLSSRPEDG